jgi:tetratricopeptide (TPR) repeat protein
MKKIVIGGLMIGFILVMLAAGKRKYGPELFEEFNTTILQKLMSLSTEFPSDSELHLGIADLRMLYESPPRRPREEEYQKVLEVDPKNLPAHAMFSYLKYQSLVGKWQENLDYWKGIKENAMQRKSEEVFLLPDDPLCEYLKNDTHIDQERGGTWTLSEFDKVKEVLLQRCYQEHQNLLKELSKTQELDPDNALYDYIQAALYLNLNMEKEALEEIRKGVNRKYCSIYEKERMKARMYVLEKMNYPWPERADLIMTYFLHSQNFIFAIWTRNPENEGPQLRLDIIGKRYEDTGDFKKAEGIYNLAVMMGKQCAKNAFFTRQEAGYLTLEILSCRSLGKLYNRIGRQDKAQEVQNQIQQLTDRRKSLWRPSPIDELFLRENLTAKELSELKAFLNQVLEKGEVEALSALK